jgi:hypothetical protein
VLALVHCKVQMQQAAMCHCMHIAACSYAESCLFPAVRGFLQAKQRKLATPCCAPLLK